jgi:hypothetical protein
MQRWQYMTWTVGQRSTSEWVVVYVDGQHGGSAQQPISVSLGKAGAEGWELTGIHSVDEHRAMYVFKRPAEG